MTIWKALALSLLLLAIAPLSAHSIDLWAGEGTSLYSLNPSTGSPTLIGDNGTHTILSLAVNPTDASLWALTFKNSDSKYWLVTLNKSTGSATEVVQLDGLPGSCSGSRPSEYRNLTVGTDGTVYVTLHFPSCSGGTSVHSIDLATGLRSFVMDGSGGGGAIATRSSTQLIVTNYYAVIARDIATGSPSTLVDGTNPSNDPDCPRTKYDVTMLVDGDTAYFRGSDPCGLGMIDLTSGLISSIGATGLFASAIAAPEPTALSSGLAALGALLAISVARRRSSV